MSSPAHSARPPVGEKATSAKKKKSLKKKGSHKDTADRYFILSLGNIVG